ncbi:MAG TPA: acetate kinase [Firmicutes bacterium]|nr:acetate kinase [Bacillota bacterium]
MKILSVNCGSSSLKFTLFELPEKKELISGTFEKIGIGNSFYTIKINGEKIKREVDLKDHSVAVQCLIDELIGNKVIANLDELDGVGHRLVHGGQKFSESIIINEDVLKAAEECIELAPIHNPANITGIKTFMDALPNTPQVAVFDTAFHQSMDKENYLYGTPYEWYEKYGVRRYGFHGTSHRYVYKTICEKLGNDKLKVINCHIGNGSSICAIDAGKVVHTTMGFTPLPGVIMGTRSGDIDPSIIPFIMKKENKTCEQVIDDLNKRSGLLGISGVSSDSRDIEDGMANGNERCILANEMLCKSVANYIAMYNNMLDGADVITFTAGLGENSIITRETIIKLIKSLGVKLNAEANDVRGKFTCISSEDSSIPVYIVPTNEELMIAIDTYELIK